MGMPFNIPSATSFKLDFVNVPVQPFFTSGVKNYTYTISLHEDSNGLPGSELEQFKFSNFVFAYDSPQKSIVLLTGVSDHHPTLFSGRKYWLTAALNLAEVPEAAAFEVAWPFNNQGYTGLHARRVGSAPWAIWGQQTMGAFRVMGKPTSGSGGNKDDSHVAFVKVATDLAEPSSGFFDLSTIDAGHSWIEVINLSSQEKQTFGTWRTTLSGGEIFLNRELNRSPLASRSLFVSKKQYDKLWDVIAKYYSKGKNAWGFKDNCTAFATDGWKAVSSEKINPYFVEDLGFPRPTWPNPVSVMYSIIDLNGDMSERTLNKCNSPYCTSPCPPPAIFCY